MVSTHISADRGGNLSEWRLFGIVVAEDKVDEGLVLLAAVAEQTQVHLEHNLEKT